MLHNVAIAIQSRDPKMVKKNNSSSQRQYIRKGITIDRTRRFDGGLGQDYFIELYVSDPRNKIAVPNDERQWLGSNHQLSIYCWHGEYLY